MAQDSARKMPRETYNPSHGWHFHDNLRSIDWEDVGQRQQLHSQADCDGSVRLHPTGAVQPENPGSAQWKSEPQVGHNPQSRSIVRLEKNAGELGSRSPPEEISSTNKSIPSDKISNEFFDPVGGRWMNAEEALEQFQSTLPKFKRVIHVDAVLDEVGRLARTVRAISEEFDPDGQASLAAELRLATRDRWRHQLVGEWMDLSELLKAMEAGVVKEQVLSQAIATMVSLKPVMTLHRRIIDAFPVTGDSSAPMPYKLANLFMHEFCQTAVFPTCQARQRWLHLRDQLRLKERLGMVASSEAADELTVAGEMTTKLSTNLQLQYLEWIPLLRFGYPELRAQIWSLVDKHCGMGALRFDVSMEDFERPDLSEVSSELEVHARSATTRREVREKKNLKEEYCIKRFSNADDFFREMEAVRLATSDGKHHPNVGEVEFAFEDTVGRQQYFFMAMPRYPMTSKQWFVTHLTNVTEVLRVLLEIVSGLSCLHRHGVIHGDLKPDNIMMDGDGAGARPKLIDFNYSAIRAGGIGPGPVEGTRTIAPELPKGVERTTTSDVYSLGRTFAVLLQGAENSEWNLPLTKHWLKQLISAMIATAPAQRPILWEGPADGGLSVFTWLEGISKITALTVPLPGEQPILLSTQRYLQALNWNLRYSFEWYGLGFIVSPSELVTVKGLTYDKRQCFIEALARDPKNSFARKMFNAELDCVDKSNLAVIGTQQRPVTASWFEQTEFVTPDLEDSRDSNAAGDRLESLAAIEGKKVERAELTVLGNERIGRGGFGLVYRGYCRGKEIAVKVFNAEPGATDTLLREVAFGIKLSHPNILTISNWAVQESKDGLSWYYLIMPLVERGSLRSVLKTIPTSPGPSKGGKLGWPTFFQVVNGVLDGLHYLATRPVPVIHRDLKPDNILLDADCTPRISDFGLAKSLSSNDHQVTVGGTCGTWHYMSPEAMQGQSTTPVSDMYSFGCILWELLHGEALWKRNSDRAAVPVLSPEVPEQIVAVIKGCIQLDPAARMKTEEARSILKSDAAKRRDRLPPYSEY